MFRIYIVYFLFFVSFAHSIAFDNENVQIVSKKLTTQENIVTATGDVVMFSQNYYVTAQKLIYDKEKGIVEFFENVNLIKNNELISFSEYLFIDLNTEDKKLFPMLMLDNKSQLWFNSTDTNATKTNYFLNDSTLSSCDCVNPAWSIGFTTGEYDTEKKWVDTYNTTLYINNFPILYTPYFGFSTNRTRRTGLLTPIIGVSNSEGLLYAQPIYYAPQDNYDMELIPQVRTSRGQGIYYNYRYKDSAYSYLTLGAGIFEENNSYQKEYNLVNHKHYGSNLTYRRTNLFSNNDTTKDGLLIQYVNMNDVDYIDTHYANDNSEYTNKFLESKIKYFYNTNKYYGDFELKYFDDLSKDNNDDIMQTLPSVNLHKYSENIFFDNLSYSLDTKLTRDTRKIGLGANTTEIYAPISYTQSFFDDYLTLQLSEQINYTNIDYTNDNGLYDSVNFGAVNHVASIYTDLIKPYETFLHTLNLNATYTKPNIFEKSGSIYNPDLVGDVNNNRLSIFPVSGTQETLGFGFSQSFYDRESLSPIVTHKMNQVYSYNEIQKKYEKGNLENDLIFYFEYGSIANRLFYNYDLKEIVASTSNLNINYENFYFKFYHGYRKNATTLLKEEYINYNLGFDFYKYYHLSYSEEYDMVQDISRKKQYIFGIDKKCWAVNLKYVNSIVATNSTTRNSLRQDIIYIEFNLKQLFNLRQNFKLE